MLVRILAQAMIVQETIVSRDSPVGRKRPAIRTAISRRWHRFESTGRWNHRGLRRGPIERAVPTQVVSTGDCERWSTGLVYSHLTACAESQCRNAVQACTPHEFVAKSSPTRSSDNLLSPWDLESQAMAP